MNSNFYKPPYREGCAATRTAAQTLTDNTWTDIILNTSEDWDYGDIHDLVTNPENFTIKVGGIYVCWGLTYWDPNAVGIRGLQIKNKTRNRLGACDYRINLTATNFDHNICGLLLCNAGDIVCLQAYQNSTGNLDLTNTWFAMQRVG